MRVEGAAPTLAAVLFPHGLVPEILRLIVDVWRTITPPKNDEDEPKITNRFVLAMTREATRRRSLFRIMAHVKDLEDLDPASGKGYVEIDIYIPDGFQSCRYFGIEAKKLNTTSEKGKWQSRAGEYVGSEGMGCFIDGRYSRHQREGAMVGYVMDGNCSKAKKCIFKAIEKAATVLGIKVPVAPAIAEAIADYPNAFETNHETARGHFRIHHLLLGTC